MNRKAQVGVGLGVFLVMFITIIVGIALFQASAQQIGSATTVGTFYNVTYDAVAEGTVIPITGYRTISGVTITNASAGALTIPTTNYTITNEQVVNGVVTATVTVGDGEFEDVTWNISSTSAQPSTYISDSGARAITGIIVIFLAIAIAFIALGPVLRSDLLGKIGR